MRNSFLALLLANLAFAAWQYWFAAPTGSTYVAPDLPTIELASERRDASDGAAPPVVAAERSPPAASEIVDEPGSERADAPAAQAPPESGQEPGQEPGEQQEQAQEQSQPPVAAPAPTARCVSVGPFRELAQATGAATTLRASGYAPTQRAGEGDILVGYWVYIAAIPSPEEAAQIVENLRQNGITDSYVIPESDSGSLVSLGVFSEIARAEGRRDEARTLGYETVMSDRTRRGTVYWLDMMLDIGRSLDFDLLQSPGRILRLEQRPCPRGEA